MLAIRQTVRVLPGHRVEIVVPELAVGEIVEEVVSPRPAPAEAGRSIVEFLESLPAGPRAFATWDEYEQHLRELRSESPSMHDRLQGLIGQAQDLPPDASPQIDRHLYGMPKRPGGNEE